MQSKECTVCQGNGEVSVGHHHFPRFGVVAMASDCHVCSGTGRIKPKTILRKRGSECFNKNLRPIVTSQTAKPVLELAVQSAV